MAAPEGWVVLAVDGGNTKTLAMVADERGRIVGRARGGGSDVYTIGEEGVTVIADTARAALAEAGADTAVVAAAVFSLAGADWPEDIAYLERALTVALGFDVEPLVVNDSMGALRVGAPTWEGVVIVCGTFNAVGARRDGRMFHLVAWPDRTGGYDLANAALRAVYRQGLGLGPPTELTPRLLGRYGCCDPLELLHAFNRRENQLSPAGPDGVTPLLLDLADDGDAVAMAIVTEAGTWLGDEGRVSAEHVGLPLDGALVVLTGGVLQHPARLLTSTIMSRLPGAVAVRPAAPPVIGALLLGYDRLGVAVDEGLLVDRRHPIPN